MLPGMMQTGFYGSAVLLGDVTIAVQDFVTGSATGDLDVTSSAISGITPKATFLVEVFADNANGDSETAHASYAMCSVDGSASRNSTGRSSDNLASTSTRTNNNGIALSIIGTAASLTEVSSASLISGGVRLNYSTNDATSRRASAVFITGNDATAHVATRGLGTGTSEQNITTVGFQPDVIIFHSACMATGASIQSGFWASFGIARSDAGVVTQRCAVMGEISGGVDGRPYQAILTDACGGQVDQSGAGMNYKYSASNFDSDGFSLTCNASASSKDVYYLALKLTNRRTKLVDFSTPTSTGNNSITGVGFEPQFAIACLTNLEATGEGGLGSTSDLQSGFSINFIGDEQWANAIRMDSAADPTDTASMARNVALLGPSSTSCAAIVATLVSFDSDGMTLNYSAVQGTAKIGFILFIE